MASKQDLIEDEPSKLVAHAEEEMRLIGMYDDDADYGGGMIAGCVTDLVKMLAGQHHSGNSAAMVIELFNQVARWELLSEPTDDPAEWEDRSEQSGTPLWQNKRGPSYFSEDGGKHWKRVDNDTTGTSKSASPKEEPDASEEGSKEDSREA